MASHRKCGEISMGRSMGVNAESNGYHRKGRIAFLCFKLEKFAVNSGRMPVVEAKAKLTGALRQCPQLAKYGLKVRRVAGSP